MKVGAIEAGGTKFVCGIVEIDGSASAADGSASATRILSRKSIPTTSPPETLGESLEFFRREAHALAPEGLSALGIGSFGPVDLHESSPTWGYITATPKPRWRNTRVAGYFRDELGLPVAFDTDVNGAAYGELLWGAARGLRDFVYITVGTGIGGGVYSNGALLHGLSHPELGHLKVQREPGDPFAGACPFHKDCLEGMASGPAVAARWNARPEELPQAHEAWELEARYLARAFAGFALILSPERILLGGGVGLRPGMAERVSTLVGEELAGYLPPLASREALARFVVRPELGADAGLLGAAALAIQAPL
jgi:fructokinase